MLNGIDISKWQHSNTIEAFAEDFVIIKATEGVNYKDNQCDSHIAKAQELNKLIAFYHYARPETPNTPESEVDSFLSVVQQFLGNAIFALDWEGASLDMPTDWAFDFLNIFYERTGIRPLIYLNQSEATSGKYNRIIEANFGLWLADYEGELCQTPWSVVAIRQYTSTPIDKDLFYGSVEEWKKYCKSDLSIKSDETFQVSPVQDSPAQPCDVMPCNEQLKVGKHVTLKSPIDFNGVENDSWVMQTIFSIVEIEGDRVVIGTENGITGAWNQIDLELV